MSDSILINFATRQLKEARELSKQIAKQVQDTARKLKDLPKDVRQSFRQAAKNAADARKAEIEAMERRLGLLRSWEERIRGRDLGASQFITRGSTQGKEALEKGIGVLNAATTGDLGRALGVLGKVPVAGQLATVASIVLSAVMPFLQRELDARLAAAEVQFRARLERDSFERDVSRRFREDRRFRDDTLQRAVREQVEQDERLRRGRWRRRGNHLAAGE